MSVFILIGWFGILALVSTVFAMMALTIAMIIVFSLAQVFAVPMMLHVFLVIGIRVRVIGWLRLPVALIRMMNLFLLVVRVFGSGSMLVVTGVFMAGRHMVVLFIMGRLVMPCRMAVLIMMLCLKTESVILRIRLLVMIFAIFMIILMLVDVIIIMVLMGIAKPMIFFPILWVAIIIMVVIVAVARATGGRGG